MAETPAQETHAPNQTATRPGLELKKPLAQGPVFIIVMGVSGTGKSTLGKNLAKALGMPYVEGDDLHPKSNIEKMSNGIALTDADREPWLGLIRKTAVDKVDGLIKESKDGKEEEAKKLGVVITCSSLKRYYRDILRGKRKVVSTSSSTGALSKEDHADSVELQPPASPSEEMPTYFVFIDGTRELLMDRMMKRPGHFMKASMLDGQLATLESPVGEEGVVRVDAEWEPEEQVRRAVDGLKEAGAI